MSTATIIVDGARYTIEAAENKNLLEACLSLGLDVPYFCWHPAMHSVGACRQCAVKLFKDEADTRGRLAMACMTPIIEGLRASIDDQEARAFRAGVIEWLMVNHPHDCPICDEGGECHLQDMTVMTGHVRRNYRFDKREHKSQDLGPLVAHEMNRCIQCYRCLRFYKDYAGGKDFDVLSWHDSVFFGRVASDPDAKDGKLESPFSGNLLEVCPTGVFTDKTQAAYPSRKWDLHTAPSVCPHCALGCSTMPGERYGKLKRVRPRYNADVNGYFLCDRGRFGQAFADAATRLAGCLVRTNEGRSDSNAPQPGGAANISLAGAPTGQAPVPRETALAAARLSLRAGGGAIGIGSPRASMETNYALRGLVGADRFFLAVPDEELALHRRMADALAAAGRRAASPKDAEAADAVLILGEDVWNTAPILALRLRQASRNLPNQVAAREKRIPAWDDAALREAVQDKPGPFFIASPSPSPLDESAEACYRAAPDDIARLGFAVAALVEPAAAAQGLDLSPEGMAEAPARLAQRIASALMRARQPLIVSGSSLGSPAAVDAAVALFSALLDAGQDARISLVFPEANSLGASMLAAGGLESAERALDAAAAAGPTALVVAEADLSRATLARDGRGAVSGLAIMAKAQATIVIDHTTSPTTEAADIVLPSATLLEGSGTFVSLEGRAQRFFALRKAAEPVQDAWRWLDGLAAPDASATRSLDDIDGAIARELPALAAVAKAAPGSDYRSVGRKVARSAERESGRTAMYANIEVREPNPQVDPDSSLAYTMEGPRSAPPPLLPRYWAPGWNSDQAINKFQIEVGGLLKDPSTGGPAEIGARIFVAETDREALRKMSGGAAREAAPPAFAPRADALLVLPRRVIFGTEELSAKAPVIAGLAPEPRLFLSIPDAGKFGLVEGATAEIVFEDAPGAGSGARPDPVLLPISLADLPEGVAALPWGLPALPGSPLAAWAGVRPSK